MNSKPMAIRLALLVFLGLISATHQQFWRNDNKPAKKQWPSPSLTSLLGANTNSGYGGGGGGGQAGGYGGSYGGGSQPSIFSSSSYQQQQQPPAPPPPSSYHPPSNANGFGAGSSSSSSGGGAGSSYYGSGSGSIYLGGDSGSASSSSSSSSSSSFPSNPSGSLSYGSPGISSYNPPLMPPLQPHQQPHHQQHQQPPQQINPFGNYGSSSNIGGGGGSDYNSPAFGNSNGYGSAPSSHIDYPAPQQHHHQQQQPQPQPPPQQYHHQSSSGGGGYGAGGGNMMQQQQQQHHHQGSDGYPQTTGEENLVTGIQFDCQNRATGHWRDSRYCDVFHACVFGEQKKTYSCPYVGERSYYDESLKRCEFIQKNPSGCQGGNYYH